VTNAWLTMALWPARPLGRQGGEVDRGSKGAKGEGGSRKGVSFSPDPPWPATISKMPVKPPRSSPTDSTGVVIPNTGTLIEYDAVALELVR
jgi:hypothetical protein